MHTEQVTRCSWPTKDALYVTYHDEEWGRPVHDDVRLFEQLVLEGAQAGLSWITILKRRHHYKRVFCNYELAKLAAFTPDDIAHALQDKGIIRNRLKVQSVVNNAGKFIAVQQELAVLMPISGVLLMARPSSTDLTKTTKFLPKRNSPPILPKI